MICDYKQDCTPITFDVDEDFDDCEIDFVMEDILVGGGTGNHDELDHRDWADQHPISAITDLQDELDNHATNDYVDEQIEEVTENIDDVANDLQTEAETRASADAELGDRIDGLADDIGTETTARQTADLNLQTQIDAIVSASDVVDVVGTYQELLDYDTTHLRSNDIVKVLADETHSNARSYYRWLNNQWNYIGSEAISYTKAEEDALLNQKVDKVTGKQLSTEDFTTVEKTKLTGIEAGAEVNDVNDVKVNGTSVVTNKVAEVTVPTALDDLTDDSTHRLVTDTEKATWNAKYTKPQTGIPSTDLASDVQATLDDVDAIESKIPAQATSTNKLADKEFVNSSIATNTATFRGTYTSVDDFPTTGVDDNDYVFLKVMSTEEPTQVERYDRYKWNGTQFAFEFSLNNSSFTAEQWSAINSGITSGLVALIGTALQPNDNVSELINDSGYQTASDVASALTPYRTSANQDIIDSGKEDTSNKVTSLSASSTDTQYPSAKAVYDHTQSVDAEAVETVETISASSTHAQIPTAKAVYDIKAKEATVTLAIADWSNKQQTVNVTGVTATNIVIVSPSPTYISKYSASGIRCIAQASGTLTFECDTVPTEAIEVGVVIL